MSRIFTGTGSVSCCLLLTALLVWSLDVRATNGLLKTLSHQLRDIVLVAIYQSGRRPEVCHARILQTTRGLQITQRCSEVTGVLRNPDFLRQLGQNPEQVIQKGRNPRLWTSISDIGSSTRTDIHQSELALRLILHHPANTIPALSFLHSLGSLAHYHPASYVLPGASSPLSGLQRHLNEHYHLINPSSPDVNTAAMQLAGIWNNPQKNGQQLIFQPEDDFLPASMSACQGGFKPSGLPRCIQNIAYPHNRVIGFFTKGQFDGLLFPEGLPSQGYQFFHTLQHLMKIMGIGPSSCAAEAKQEDSSYNSRDNDGNDDSGASPVF